MENNARCALRDLKHTGTILDYGKKFSALMLGIKDMSEKDELFFFLEAFKHGLESSALRTVLNLSRGTLAPKARIGEVDSPKVMATQKWGT